MRKMLRTTCAVLAVVAAARAGTVKVADCVRNAELDQWAAYDVRFCRTVMDAVFKRAGLDELKRKEYTDGILLSATTGWRRPRP